jgi:hypothetical protein
MALPQVYARFVEAGLDRSLRTLQRYCEQGHLRAAKYPTETGAVWYVDPESVETKIEEIRQVQETLHRPAAPSHDTTPPTANDMSRHDTDRRSMSSMENKPDNRDSVETTSNDEPRQQNLDADRRSNAANVNGSDADQRQTATDGDDKYVTVPVVVLDALTAQLAAKDDQLKRQDAQMERMVAAHDKDRQLLGAALAIIHHDDFPKELTEGNDFDRDASPRTAEEIKPEFRQGGGNSQPGPSNFGV